MINTFNTILAVSTLLIGALAVITLILVAIRHPFGAFMARHSTLMLRVIFVGAALGSLTYELVFGYAPCLLCWYQRMAIFPIAILLWTADIRESALLREQISILAALGFLVALLHNYIDAVPNGLDICSFGPSCLLRYVNAFGFVTIPLMSAIVLFSGLVFVNLAKRYPQLSRI